MKNTNNHKEKRFFGVFKTFEDFENYLAMDEEPTLNYVHTMKPLSPCAVHFLAKLANADIRKN